MTIEKAIEILDPETRREAMKGIAWDKKIDTDQEACRLAIAALRAQQEAEKNEPLTLEELREMDGEPVFITHSRHGKSWCIIDWHGVNKSWFYFSKTGTAEGMTAVPVAAATYGGYWLAYRHKPEEKTKC